MQNLFNCVLIAISASILSPVESSLKVCGKPGSPKNLQNGVGIQYDRNQYSLNTFYADTIADYKCSPNALIFGSNKRQCLLDGSWSGKVPSCVLPVSTTQFVKSYTTISRFQHDASRATDGKINTCFEGIKRDESEDFRWFVKFKTKMPIRAVRISYDKAIKINYTLWIESHDGFRRWTCDKSQVYNDEKLYNSISHYCIGTIDSDGIQIIFTSFEASLCEVDIFVSNDDCGLKLPDIPAFGFVKQKFINDQLISQFQCHNGYTLNGTHEVSCARGSWSSASPVCISNEETNRNLLVTTSLSVTTNKKHVFKCPLLYLKDSEGTLYQTDSNNIGSKAFLKCPVDFWTEINSTECLQSGVWSHEVANHQIVCKKINCETNILIPHGHVSFQNVPNPFNIPSIKIQCEESSVEELRYCGANNIWVKEDKISSTNLTDHDIDLVKVCLAHINHHLQSEINFILIIISALLCFLIFSWITVAFIKRRRKSFRRNPKGKNAHVTFKNFSTSNSHRSFLFVDNPVHCRSIRESHTSSHIYQSIIYEELDVNLSRYLETNEGVYSEPIDAQENRQSLTLQEGIYAEPYFTNKAFMTRENEIYGNIA